MFTGSDDNVMLTGMILGVGIISSLDAVILHQLLRWHRDLMGGALPGLGWASRAGVRPTLWSSE